MAVNRLKMGQGKVVTGDWFWNREKERQLLIERVDNGAHQVLVAQRRMGKTSLMAEAERSLADRYVCLFVDVQKCNSGADVVVELSLKVRRHERLWEKAKGVFTNVLERIKDNVESVQIAELGVTLRAGLAAANWAQKGDQLLAILSMSENPVVIFFDEVPILVNRLLKDEDGKMTPNGRKRADEFMSWLRDNSIRHQGKIRMILSGSIGLAPVLHQARLSATINNFTPLEVEAWNEETAVGCIRALAHEYGLELEDGVPKEMVKRLGCCIPHHVQMFFTHLHERCVKRDNTNCSLEDVGEVYRKNMLGVRGHVEMVHYEERLEQVLDREACTLGLDMLTETAVVGLLSGDALKAFQKEYVFDERDAAQVQREILWVLEHDGYLRKGEDGYVFVSRLLRDWWKNRYEHSYTPVLERS